MKKYFVIVASCLAFMFQSCLERDNPLDKNYGNGDIKFYSYEINSESIDDHTITMGENLSIRIAYIVSGRPTGGAKVEISTESSYAYCESNKAHISYSEALDAYNHGGIGTITSYPSAQHGFLVRILDNAPMGTVIPIRVVIITDSDEKTSGEFNLIVGSVWQ